MNCWTTMSSEVMGWAAAAATSLSVGERAGGRECGLRGPHPIPPPRGEGAGLGGAMSAHRRRADVFVLRRRVVERGTVVLLDLEDGDDLVLQVAVRVELDRAEQGVLEVDVLQGV